MFALFGVKVNGGIPDVPESINYSVIANWRDQSNLNLGFLFATMTQTKYDNIKDHANVVVSLPLTNPNEDFNFPELQNVVPNGWIDKVNNHLPVGMNPVPYGSTVAEVLTAFQPKFIAGGWAVDDVIDE